jgi:hypothetical protein
VDLGDDRALRVSAAEEEGLTTSQRSGGRC